MAGKKKENGNIQRRSGDSNFFFGDPFADPGADNNYRQGVNEHHFVEFKEFVVKRQKKQGSNKEKEIKGIFDDFAG